MAVGLDTPGPASATGRAQRARFHELCSSPTGLDSISADGLEARLGNAGHPISTTATPARSGDTSRFSAPTAAQTSISSVIGTGTGRRRHHRRQRSEGQKRFRRRTGPRADSISEHRRNRRHRPAMQLRAHRRPGVALLADRHRPRRSCRIFCRVIRGTNCARSISSRRPNWSAAWRKKATRCAAIFSACRLTRSGLFFDEMVNTFDPDALIIGGGALETRQAISEVVHRRNPRRHAAAARRAGRTFRST